MANYRHILPHVFQWEGGLVYHQNEKQWTNMGVKWDSFRQLAPTLLGIYSPTVENLKHMTQAQVEKFIEYYWNKATFNNSIINQDAANLMYQAYWGSGGAGIKEMQQALNQAFGSKLNIDGGVGYQTVLVINAHPSSATVLYNAMEARYKRLAQQPQYAKYLNGWLNRLATLKPGVVFGLTGLLLLAATFFF